MTRHVLALALAALCAPLPAAAGTIGVFTHDYGISLPLLPKHRPEGSVLMLPNAAVVDDSPSGDVSGAFRDRFDLSSLADQVIRSFTLTLNYGGILPSSGEQWFLDIYGSRKNRISDNVFVAMPTNDLLDLGPGTVSLSVNYATDDARVDAFAHALETLEVEFGFDQIVAGSAQDFLLYDAVLTVNGAAVVPLPAPGALLAGALLGAGLWRRRRSRGAAAPSAA